MKMYYRVLDSVYRYEITKNVLLTDPGLPIPQSEVRDENTGKWCYTFLCSTSDGKKQQILNLLALFSKSFLSDFNMAAAAYIPASNLMHAEAV